MTNEVDKAKAEVNEKYRDLYGKAKADVVATESTLKSALKPALIGVALGVAIVLLVRACA